MFSPYEKVVVVESYNSCATTKLRRDSAHWSHDQIGPLYRGNHDLAFVEELEGAATGPNRGQTGTEHVKAKMVPLPEHQTQTGV